eukprot:3528225-Rhodomonas_salina.3
MQKRAFARTARCSRLSGPQTQRARTAKGLIPWCDAGVLRTAVNSGWGSEDCSRRSLAGSAFFVGGAPDLVQRTQYR